MMTTDPTIAAVRETRHRISASVDHDPKRLVERYKGLQREHPEKLLQADALRTMVDIAQRVRDRARKDPLTDDEIDEIVSEVRRERPLHLRPST